MHYEIDLTVLGLLVVYGVFAKLNLLPSVDSIQSFVSMTNSKGGNIMVLGGMSLIFFGAAVRMTYWCLERTIEGKLTVDNAVMMMGLTFITGSCFGGSFSSMLKVMSGEEAKPPVVSSDTKEVREAPATPSV